MWAAASGHILQDAPQSSILPRKIHILVSLCECILAICFVMQISGQVVMKSLEFTKDETKEHCTKLGHIFRNNTNSVE